MNKRSPQLYKSKSSNGFTLIELMITLVIAAILITVGVPSFRDILVRNRVASHQLDLISSLNLARSEAVSRGTLIGVCGRSTATACVTNNDWSGGWLIFVDDDNDGIRDAGEEILRNYDYQGSSEAIVDDNTFSVYLSFNQRGYLSTIATTGTPILDGRATIKICEEGDDLFMARAVIIGPTGRVSKSYDLDGDSVFEDVNGNNLNC
jgi:type IV fimbrial biogenesis protein FimT